MEKIKKLTKFEIAVLLEKFSRNYGLVRYQNVVPFVGYYSRSELYDMLVDVMCTI